jgi:hypothetical protein
MNSPDRFKKIVALAGVAAAVALSSCTLPPDQAWRKIRTDGLIAYWSYELDSQRAYLPSRRYNPPYRVSPMRETQLAQTPQQSVPPISRPGVSESRATLTAQSIPALPGFVRSPYTNPPRLVDVKGATPGSTMICPYTHRPFVVPSDFASAPGTAVADATPPSPAAPSVASGASEPATAPAPASRAESLPKVVIGDQNRPVEPAPLPVAPAPTQPRSVPAPAAKAPASALSSVSPAPPAAAPKPVQAVPYGSAIAGRPGFVNSPYAAKHQLVDVTGLPAGMEVKCPYTGKLFRVPLQDVVSTLPGETAPLASPEEPKKK